MNKLKEINVILVMVITILLLPTSYCQYSQTSPGFDMLSAGIRSMFGFDNILKTYRKVSSGLIPFPFFVPIVPRSRFVQLLRGKRSKTEEKSLSESTSSPCQLDPVAVPPPASFMQKNRPLPPNPYLKHNEYPFFGIRPIKIGPDYPYIATNALTDHTHEEVRPTGFDLHDMQYGDESSSYSERYESGVGQDLDKDTIESPAIPTPMQVVQNWDTIDDELRRIGYQLGKLGNILHKN